MENRNNTGLIVLVIILLVVCLSMAGYIAYDKLISKDAELKTEENINEETENTEEGKNIDNTKEEIIQQDAAYFDEYLEYFQYILPLLDKDESFVKTKNDFSSEDITRFLYFYLLSNVNQQNTYQIDDNLTGYNVSKNEIDKVVKMYFGDINYEIVENSNIKKLSDTEYQISWGVFGMILPSYENIGLVYNGKNVEIKYEMKEPGGDEIKTGILTYKLLYNDGNYNFQSVEYKKY